LVTDPGDRGGANRRQQDFNVQPLFDCGSVAKSDDTVMARVLEYAAERE
jgi:hypothetical protein